MCLDEVTYLAYVKIFNYELTVCVNAVLQYESLLFF